MAIRGAWRDGYPLDYHTISSTCVGYNEFGHPLFYTQRTPSVARTTRRLTGPRLFGPVMERSNSCARIGGHSHAVRDQTAGFLLFLGAHAGVFVVT